MAYIEISRDNFEHNLNQIALKTQSREAIALVLKDNAYGHGLEPMAKLASEWGVRHAVVRSLAEAERIKGLFETVLVLADTPSKAPGTNVHIALNDLRQIEAVPAKAAVELKIDTGMHRNGIPPEALGDALEAVERRGLLLKGIMTHHRAADEMGSEFFWQKKRFDEVRNQAEKWGVKEVRWHSCNSAALFRTETFDEEIARIGIAAYGCLRMPEPFKIPEFRPVMSLWAERVATRRLESFERVGYGGEGRLPEGGTLSTYDVGYGDGWIRGNAAHPYRIPDGRRVVGRVSMDMFSLEGDEERVCLFRDADEAARHFDTIAYDVMVKLSPRLRRVVV